MSIPIDLTCGPLRLMFEPSTGFVRYVRHGTSEVLRGIYAAVRDHNWDTVPAVLTDLRVSTAQDGFDITFNVHCHSSDVDFAWHGTIVGEPSGRLTYRLDGVATSTFRRNRIGFCVLHPPGPCRGKPCRIERDDGTVQEGEFPLHIWPHQPFKGIRAITHEVVSGVDAEVRFAGDVFEMEDQRNWTDASYKTYCTPLDLPFPVEVTQGTRFSQSVTLTLKGESSVTSGSSSIEASPVELGVIGKRSPLPAIGLGAASHDRPLGPRQREALLALKLAHLRVDLPLFETDWPSIWARAVAEATAIDVPLEVAFRLGENADEDLSRFADTYAVQSAPVVRWLVFGQDHLAVDSNVLATVRERCHTLAPGTSVGSGTNAYFAELNRQRPSTVGMDVVVYSINPQVHAFDDASLVETLPMQAETLSSARVLVGETPVAVTPVTLRPRFNPNATGPEAPTAPHHLPPQVDPRQSSRFAAAWTLGSLKHLAEAGAASVTYYETTGWRGVMETEAGSPLPDLFPSTPGSVFPLYRVFAEVAHFKGGEVEAMYSSIPLSAEAVLLRRGHARRMIVANYQGRTTAVCISLPRGVEHVDVTPMDGDEEVEADLARDVGADDVKQRRLNVELPPHGLVRLEWKANDDG
jgi:D-apionolactonase